MPTQFSRNILLLMILTILLPILAACTGEEPAIMITPVATQTPTAMVATSATVTPIATTAPKPTAAPSSGEVKLPDVNPAAVSGNISIAGSSTVYPLTERMAELFKAEGYSGNITVSSIGSGAGFERFCVAAETDIANASRPIKSEEIASCKSKGRDPIEFRVGTDALAVVVSTQNTFVNNLTKEELAAVFSTATTWADVNPSWPAERIQRYIPGTDSGTFDYFVEEVFAKDKTPILAANPQMSEDDNVLVQGIMGSPYAIGFFGYAYYHENQSTLKALSINGVAPTEETAENHTYPLSRPLFIYSSANIMKEKPQVAAFINYYLTNVNNEVKDVGYFPASKAALDTARKAWLQAVGDVTDTTKPKTTTTTAPTTPIAPPSSGAVKLPDVNPAAVSGNISIAGSSTVYPLTERMAELFKAEGYSGNITVSSIGSGAGFERFCVAAETDIANASRPIKSEEIASCQSKGREPIEFRVGTDALAVVMSTKSTFVNNLTKEELAAVFSTATTWADVNPSWPAERIQRYIPGTDSGTFDYFVEEVFAKDKTPILAANPQMSEDDNVLVQGIMGSPYAIGFFGYAYYHENQSNLKALSINGVAPTEETAENHTYPLSRPLFIYSSANIMKEKPQVAAFINYYLTNVNNEVKDVGYFPASKAALDTARQRWLNAMGETAAKPAETTAETTTGVTTTGVLPEVNPASVSGNISIAGSSTVYPLTERMAELFKAEGYSGNITVSSIGSGAGFERFCVAAETDIANASRPIKSEEIASCQSKGREPIEFRVGTDALVVVMSTKSTFVDNLTKEELAAVFSTATTWADVNPSWPAERIQRYIPGTDSGTFDYFVEEVFAKDKTPILAANPQMSEDDNVLVQGIMGSPYAIGFFGYAYYHENQSTLKALSINGVAPTEETAENHTYPLSRPLFIYSSANIMKEKPQVAAFINYYLTDVNNEIKDVGYFPASKAALDTARQRWLNAMK